MLDTVEVIARLVLPNGNVDPEAALPGAREALELTPIVVLLSSVVGTKVVPVEMDGTILELITKVVLLGSTVVLVGADETAEVDVTDVPMTPDVVVELVLLRSSVDSEETVVALVMTEVGLAAIEFRTGKVVDGKGTEDGDVGAVMARSELRKVELAGVVEMLVPLAPKDVVGLVALPVEEGVVVVTKLVVEEARLRVVRGSLAVADIKVVVETAKMTGGALAVELSQALPGFEKPESTLAVLLRAVVPVMARTEFAVRAVVVLATLEVSVVANASTRLLDGVEVASCTDDDELFTGK